MSKNIKKEKNKNEIQSLIILLIFTFFMVTGFEMIMPLIIGHYVNNLHFLATKVALALAMRKFFQQGLAIFGGILADRKDIKKLIALGMFTRVIGFCYLGSSNNFQGLFFSMILIGLGGILFEAPYQTAIALLTTEENRARYYSLNNTIIGIASTFGPLLGAFLLKFNFQIVSYGAAICFFINFLLSLIALPSIKKNMEIINLKESLKILGKDKKFNKFIFLMILFWLPASQIDISFPLKIVGITNSSESVSWIYSIYAAITTLFQYPLITFLSKKFSSEKILSIGIFFISFSLFVIPFLSSLFPFLLIVALFTVGMILSRPNQQNVAVKLANHKYMGLYMGYNYMSFAIGNGCGTILGGFLFDFSKGKNIENLPWFLFSTIAFITAIRFIKNSKNITEEFK